MKALSLHGPWAYYERKAAENECRIADLESEVRKWKSQHDDLKQQLEKSEAERMQVQGVQLPGLLADKDKSQGVIDKLQAELQAERLARGDEHHQLTMEVSSLTQELQKLSADNAVLRSELAKTVHAKQLTSHKLEQIRKKLGLSESEAKAFIQELDEARAASKALREENKELAADNAHLKQQLDSRSQHCMTLIGENKRLLEQVADLRMNLQKQQGELWQAKTEQQNAVAAARQLQQASSGRSRTSQVVVREWVPPPGEPGSAAGTTGTGTTTAAGTRPRSSSSGGLAACASAVSVATSLGAGASGLAARRAGGKQNRPPWNEGSGGKTAAATGPAKAAVVHIPIGITAPGNSDAAKASVVRQALAVRQQRVASTVQEA